MASFLYKKTDMRSRTFGETIKMLRKKHKYSLKEVGEYIKYNASSLSAVEKNNKRAPEEIIRPLSEILKVDYKKLMIKYLSEKVFYEVKNSDYAQEALKVVMNRLKKEGKGTQEVKDKEDILKEIKIYFSKKPINKAWIFGSFARNSDISFDSDIDILVEFEKPNKITLFDLIEMKNELSDKTGREIDLVEEGQELKSMSHQIQGEKVLVYAK